MDFQVGNIRFSVSPSRAASNLVFRRFQEEADSAASTFASRYKSNIHSLEELVNYANACFYDAIKPAVSTAIKMLLEKGIYDIDEDAFVQRYANTSVWDAAYGHIEDQYIDIVATEEEKDAYRVARRQNRSRWQGGGFGLGGAVKGAAKAGAMNMASGAMHMAFNGVAKVGSTIAATAKCSSLFNDSRTYLSLWEGVFSTVSSLAEGYARCLADHHDNTLLKGFPSGSDRQQALRIMNNISQLPSTDSRSISMLQNAFQLDPYCDKIYLYLLDYFTGEIKSIRTLAEYFKKTNIIDQYCTSMLQQAAAKYSFATEESTKQAKQDYQKLLNQLQTQDSLGLMTKIDAKLVEFDRIARTFEGVEYATRGESAKAREEAQWIDNLLSNLKEQSLDELKNNREKILSKCSTQQVIEKRLKKLDKLLDKKDLQERTVDGIEHENLEQAAQAKTDAALIHTELADARSLSLDELKQKREKIAEQCTSDLAKKYLEKLDAAIDKKEQKKGKKIKKGYLDFRTPKQYKPHTVRNIILILLGIFIFFILISSVVDSESPSQIDDPSIVAEPDASAGLPAEEAEIVAEEPTSMPYVPATNLNDYTGSWMVDRFNSYMDGYVGFTIENANDQFYFSANGVWNQGDRVNNIDYALIELNYEGSQAGGYYEDGRGNFGDIILDFEDGELYLTITAQGSGDYSFGMEHEHCTRDNIADANELYEPEIMQEQQSYQFYHESHTYSNGMNSLSGYAIGDAHFWPTDTLTITDSDLIELTRVEVAAIRNEIYARHGYTFSSQEWAAFFATASWYQPDTSFSNDMLNTTEKQNVETIAAYEQLQGWNQ